MNCSYILKKGKQCSRKAKSGSYCLSHKKFEKTFVSDITIYDLSSCFVDILKYLNLYELNIISQVSKEFNYLINDNYKILVDLIVNTKIYYNILNTYNKSIWFQKCLDLENGVLCEICVKSNCECVIFQTDCKKIYKLTDQELSHFNHNYSFHRMYRNRIIFYNKLEILKYVYGKSHGLTNFNNLKIVSVENKIRNKQLKLEKEKNKKDKENQKWTTYYENLTKSQIKEILEDKLIKRYNQIINDNIAQKNENQLIKEWMDNYNNQVLYTNLTASERTNLLDSEFSRQLMFRREDSTLCKAFINGSLKKYRIKHVVAIMLMTDILFQYSYFVYSEFHTHCNNEMIILMAKNRNNYKYTWYDAVEEMSEKYKDIFQKSCGRSSNYHYGNIFRNYI